LRLLITGASGLVGGRLASLLAVRHEVIAAVHVAPGPYAIQSHPLDLTAGSSVEAAFNLVRPQGLIHAAALADADRCERNPALATELNVRATERIAAQCARRGVRLVVLSTDLVLDGHNPFSNEVHATKPSLVYGRTKRQAEQVVLGAATDAAVLRISLVHGRGHGSRATASESILQGLRAGRRMQLYTDQHRTPVDPESLAAAIECVLSSKAAGLFHVGGPERLSRYALGLRVASLFGFTAELLEPVTQAERSQTVRRPADVSLDSSRAREELHWLPRPLDEALKESRAESA
jgi:dTDP-4-dehydrorhamnose reductase